MTGAVSANVAQGCERTFRVVVVVTTFPAGSLRVQRPRLRASACRGRLCCGIVSISAPHGCPGSDPQRTEFLTFSCDHQQQVEVYLPATRGRGAHGGEHTYLVVPMPPPHPDLLPRQTARAGKLL